TGHPPGNRQSGSAQAGADRREGPAADRHQLPGETGPQGARHGAPGGEGVPFRRGRAACVPSPVRGCAARRRIAVAPVAACGAPPVPPEAFPPSGSRPARSLLILLMWTGCPSRPHAVFYNRAMRAILLLTLANVFMTFAWYGHLQYKN